MANCTVYVGNAPYDITEQDLRDLFFPLTAKCITIVMDREHNRPRGFNFVELLNFDDARAAVKALDNTEWKGRTLKVDFAKEREPQRQTMPRGGGGSKSSKNGKAERVEDYGKLWRSK